MTAPTEDSPASQPALPDAVEPDDVGGAVIETSDIDLLDGRTKTEDLDLLDRRTEIEDRSHFVRSVVDAWKSQQEQDRQLRSRYLIWGMFGQALVINVVIFFVGFRLMTIDGISLRIFIAAVFGELAAMVFFIVKYLFRSTGDAVLELINPHSANKLEKPHR